MIVESASEANAQFVLPHALSLCSWCTCRWTWAAGRSELIRQAARILTGKSKHEGGCDGLSVLRVFGGARRLLFAVWRAGAGCAAQCSSEPQSESGSNSNADRKS